MSENHDIFNTIASQAKNVTLSDKEKATLFRTVDAYVSKHPITTPATRPTVVVSPFSGMRWFQYLGTNHSSSLSFALVVFVVLGAGTSFAARGSLPGDLLYAVKVGVNEQVRSVFSTDLNKAAYEATLAIERLKEGQSLAAQGKLTPELQTEIEARFEQHAARVQKDAEEFTTAGEYSKALKVSEEFETVLKNEEPAADGAFANKIKSAIEMSSVLRSETENSIAVTPLTKVNTDELRKVAMEKQNVARASVARIASVVAAEEAARVASAPTSAKNAAAKVSTKKAALSASAPAPAVPSTAKSAAFSAASTMVSAPLAADTGAAPVSTTTVSLAESLLKQGDEAFAAEKYNEAFSLYRQAQDVAAQAEALLIKSR